MQRIGYLIAFALIAGLAVLIGLNVLSSPVEARREAFEIRLEEALTTNLLVKPSEQVDYEDIQHSITSKPNLWAPLTKVQRAAAKPPNLEQMLEGVSISRNTIGSGADIKIKIMSQDNRRGAWVSIGGNVRGLTVKSIDSRRKSVTFMKLFQGREYTFTLTP
jgi:hypothetical protein